MGYVWPGLSISKAVASAPTADWPAKELVLLKLESDVLSYFRADCPGWQDRINDSLRAATNRKN
ncbi:hypothetical protein G6M87_24430 [Rhizobium rhizogenes]|nr:hypothetical protein [Rhizobium rhizogenes]NTI26670.1 hypothetical protein [Rhizobium rhizogenes]NTI31300.1 hypothetical protein [Rhizobium rhizogenes]NTI75884.1 hypothetical protein [Rhizobium rhizogenes]QTG08635.1 hypothetical protein G6M87_24430 [Rhizobium rhizogenes]